MVYSGFYSESGRLEWIIFRQLDKNKVHTVVIERAFSSLQQYFPLPDILNCREDFKLFMILYVLQLFYDSFISSYKFY